MSLIITNKNTLKDTAIVVLKNANGERKITTNGDLTTIEVNGEAVGLNIRNYSNYFAAHEGARTINKQQIDAIAKLGHEIKELRHFFSVGEVLERTVHPKSEKLFLLKVKADKELQIVTNSLNSLVGTKVVVARVGAVLPSGLSIEHSKVMGIESEGMLCGGETLGREATEGVLLVEGIPGEEFIL